MENNLFNEFEPVSSQQWKQQIQYELKGADYNEVIWESPEGIKVKPFYHADDFENKIAVSTNASKFKIIQDIFVHDVAKSNSSALNSLSRGAESIRFTIETEDTDIEKLLSQLPLNKIPVYFNLNFLSDTFIKKIDVLASKNQDALFFVQLDPIGKLAGEGNWFYSLEKDFEIINNISLSCNHIHFLSINSSLYQNAGANIVQQIAYTLAHANEYFNRMATIQKPAVLQVAAGANYFFEIAKLRAMRLLFSLIAKEYGHDMECHIIASPTKRNKTLYDYNVNMLRTTTECMSAILGGADAVYNLPYDALYHKSNEFGDRISRNQLLVLKHESYFDKTNNPADGSYYIETLTHQLAEKALELFKEIEASGGFLHQLKDGTIQRKIQQSALKEQELFDSGKEILLGTNKYPNKNDRMSHDLELYPFVKTKTRKTLITPVIEKRLAEKMEQDRLASEKEAENSPKSE